MTENQWPEASARSPLDQYGNAAPQDLTAQPESPNTKKDAAKQEASWIAVQAAGGAQNVVQAAKHEAGNVAAEAKSGASDLLNQAKSGLGNQAASQQRRAAEGVRTISSQLHTMADAPEQQGVASDLVRQAAERASAAASWIEGKDPATLLDGVQSFARRNPGTFLLIAAGAGLIAGRLVRGLQPEAPAPTAPAAVPPRPLQAPASAQARPSALGDQAQREPVSAPAAYGETIYGEPARPAYAGTEAGGVPLKNLDDPYSEIADQSIKGPSS
ncbi:hypothetical protein FDW84_11485 [Pseudarthrobacter sp. NamE5]|nr:hypothetical protein [Pseudarthrobacter sp. NamE5]TLM84725.1 hypothetical protein FDW84_11485 [Pseudarthrobacter sp. NamE5]